MFKSNYLILSEGVNLDRISGSASIFNIIERMESLSFPTVMPKMCMLAYFERNKNDPSKIEIEYKLFNNDVVLQTNKYIADFQDSLKHKRVNIFLNVKIDQPGELRFSLYHENREINRYVIEVSEQKVNPNLHEGKKQ